MWFGQEAVRVRAGRKSDRGNPDGTVLDWSPGAVDRAVLPPLNIQPRIQTETAGPERTEAVTGWRVQSDEGVDLDVTELDRVEWNGLLYEVDGDVARWPDPIAGGIHHVEFNLRRVTG
ncbi:hypothetical protein ACFXCZ_27090 [Streptomyces sp. NPDC059396]|uniref:hypothetical protein n=1 Tax=Streptomyces sp. NPDC059396 TaxID=3346819 RepID=UPI0036A8F198